MSKTAVDICSHTLRGAILRGDFKVGSRLPAERDLAARFGVHRATVRTALARLTASGLVAPRQGSGYAIRDYHRTGGPDLLRDLVSLASGRRLEDSAADLLLVRRSLARAVLARLATIEIAPHARRAVSDAIDAFAEAAAARADTETLASADLAIVSRLLEATGSPVLQLCVNPIAAVLESVPRLRSAIYADATASVVGWRALLAWLEAPDAGQSSRATAPHASRRRAIDAILDGFEQRDALTLARLAKTHRKRSRT